MIDAGDAFMARHLNDETGSGPNLDDVLDDWCGGESTTKLPVVHIFMFTDIVDSTALTEELGNVTMQKVIQAHNRVVREALTRFGGHEVKHTGDGIMAVFNDSRFAIDATVKMQQQINLFSRQTPQLAFDIRIGLHIGEAVMEDDDYFGSTVQTAAPVCGEAGGEEIWVREDVWRACPYYADDLKYCGEFSSRASAKTKCFT